MTSRVPSLNWLRVFEAAARTSSFARAAEQLNMSAAAVSQQIKALEGHFGTALFTRHAHAVSLTEPGRAYLPSVQQALGLLEDATESLFGAAQDQPLFVQSVLLFAQGVLAQGISAFQAEHPQVQLTLSTGNTASDFAQGYNDLQIVFGNPSHFAAAHDQLMGEQVFPVAHAQIADKIQKPDDIVDHTLIEVATHRAGWAHVLHALHLPISGHRVIRADNTIMAASMVAQGAGIMLARAPASDFVVQQSQLQPCLGDWSVAGSDHYYLVYPDRQALRPAVRIFRAWILAYLAQRGAR